MRSCKETYKLLSEERKLSLWDKLEVRFHFFICKNCRYLGEQVRMMTKSFKRLMEQKSQISPQRLEELKKKIFKKVS